MGKAFFLILSCILLGLSNVSGQAQESVNQPPLSKYETFGKRSDVVIVTKAFPIGTLPGGWNISAKTAWVLDGTSKVYGAQILGRLVDFDQLKGMQDGLDRLIEAINSSFDKLNAESMYYSSPTGLSANYYSYVDSSGTAKRNLYVKMGANFWQGPSIAPLAEMRDLIRSTREKLISLGAR